MRLCRPRTFPTREPGSWPVCCPRQASWPGLTGAFGSIGSIEARMTSAVTMRRIPRWPRRARFTRWPTLPGPACELMTLRTSRRQENTMQLLLVRHALPLRSEHGQGADPDLSDAGRAQVARLPEALARFPISRLLSSPQRRAIQTAEPIAAARELALEIDDRFAEYDRDLPVYVPI